MVQNDNIFTFMYDLFFLLIKFGSNAWAFLFKTHKLGVQLFEIGGRYLVDFTYSFNVFEIMVGSGFAIFMVLALVKYFIPLA